MFGLIVGGGTQRATLNKNACGDGRRGDEVMGQRLVKSL